MGRRPNSLVVKHFNRGAKLKDSSNRYEHTCKSCGEKFPKGRADSLIGHLIKKCPKVTIDDRRKAVLELNGIPDNGMVVTNQPDGGMNMASGELRVGSQANWPPLDALALVSGAQLDAQEGGSELSEQPQTKRLKVQEQYTLDNPPVSYEQRVQNNKKSGDQKTTHSNMSDSLLNLDGTSLQRGQDALQSHHSALHGGDDLNFQLSNMATYQNIDASAQAGTFPSNLQRSGSTSSSVAHATSLAQAATAQFTSQMVDPEILRGDPNISAAHFAEKAMEEQLKQFNEENSSAMHDDFFNTDQGQQQGNWIMEAPRETPYAAPADAPLLQTNEQGQTGQFSRLVINTADTPVATEFSTEPGDGQRVNKPKSRNRFSQERRKQVQGVRQIGACIRCRMLKKPCSVETPCLKCKNVSSARIWITPCERNRLDDMLDMFAAGLHAALAYDNLDEKRKKDFHKSTLQIEASHYAETGIFVVFSVSERHMQAASNIDPTLGNDQFAHVRLLLDNENDDIPAKIQPYTKRMLPLFIQREPSEFMQVVLTSAEQINSTKPDKLLSLALEFWATVHMLFDQEAKWTLLEKSRSVASGAGPAIAQDDATYEIIRRQLSAAVEKRAAELSTAILGMLERKLLTKAAHRSFTLFIVSLLIMNCLEKSAWYFEGWDKGVIQAPWPIEKSPREYADEGLLVAAMIDMLLRMKDVPAVPICGEDEALVSDRDPEVQAFYTRIQLKEPYVIHRRDADLPLDPLDSRCFEMRYCGHLILKR